MCGIVGYIGGQQALQVILDGLARLEYRGYDSAGVAVRSDSGHLATARKAGKLANLRAVLDSPGTEPMPGTVGVGHTRWATHGGPTDRNAHPHLSCGGEVAVIHNGIIENFASLRAELESAGHEMRSDTDTEVVAHLLEIEVNAGLSLAGAMRAVCPRLEGAYTLVAVAAGSDTVVAARLNSPLVIGVGEGGELFAASDVAAFIYHTRQRVLIDDLQVVELRRDGFTITDHDGAEIAPVVDTVEWDAAAAEKDGYDWFMLKEIAEQPKAVADTLYGRLAEDGSIVLDELRLADDELRDIDKVFIIACGTSFHAGMVAKYAIEHWVRIPCEVDLASEFRYRSPVVDRSTLVVVISQSGETMDTLMALRHAREQRAKVLAITNSNGSTIARESDAVLYTRAGPEVAVASTKAFLTQLVAVYLVALYLAQVRGTMYGDEVAGVVGQLAATPQALERLLEQMEPVRAIAREIAGAPTVLFLGRHVGFPVALEGALKLKELAYMHAEGFAAGELKHGPISLVEVGTVVVVVMPSPRGRGSLHGKVVSNVQEVRARGARTIVIAEDGDDDAVPFADEIIRVPPMPTLLAPLVTTVPMQVLACEIAAARGNDVDQPRNLAKSVTVE